MKSLRETFRDMTQDEMREASREVEITSMTKNDAPIEYLTPAEFFRRMRVIRSTLEKFGFKKESGVWTYSAPIAGGALVCTVTVDASGAVKETTTGAATVRILSECRFPIFVRDAGRFPQSSGTRHLLRCSSRCRQDAPDIVRR